MGSLRYGKQKTTKDIYYSSIVFPPTICTVALYVDRVYPPYISTYNLIIYFLKILLTQSAAESGYQVVAIDLNQQALDNGMKHIKSSIDKIAAKKLETKKFTAEQADKYKSLFNSITPTTKLADAKDCDLVIEAIIENIDIKKKFYQDLGAITKPGCILASNTSSLRITDLAKASGRPAHTVGLHFFNPVQIMKLVEVVKTDTTDADVVAASEEFVEKIGKVAVACKDTPGFVVNRLLVPYLSSAISLYERGDADIEGIDNAMMLGAGHPMGPLKLADYVGLDVCLFILQGWKEKYPNEPTFIVPNILKKMVAEGKLGKKNGKGFYIWEGMKAVKPNV
jgi:3-hydroxyacyl-CoA dehydrogenase